MSMAIRFAPGLAAAIAAFAVLKLISWLGWASLTGEAVRDVLDGGFLIAVLMDQLPRRLEDYLAFFFFGEFCIMTRIHFWSLFH